MGIKFANNASSTLANSILIGATSLDVAAGEGAEFPTLGTGDYFMATIESGSTREIVKVTARSTDTFTIVRAQEGTSAQAWNAGVTISHRVTAGSLDAIATPAWTLIDNTDSPYTAVAAEHLGVDASSAAVTVNLPATPSADDYVDFFDYGGSFDTNALTIGRNGSKIMGLTEDMTASTANLSFRLTYIDATQGWVLT